MRKWRRELERTRAKAAAAAARERDLWTCAGCGHDLGAPEDEGGVFIIRLPDTRTVVAHQRGYCAEVVDDLFREGLL